MRSLRWIGWLVSLCVVGCAGFWGGWMYWGWRWQLEPLGAPPSPARCELIRDGWGPDEVWRSVWTYSPGDDSAREDVRFSRVGSVARLEIVQDGHFDDSVGATTETYWLEWKDRWRVTSCTSSVLQCARGVLPAGGACP